MLDLAPLPPFHEKDSHVADRAVIGKIADALIDRIECGLVVSDARGRVLLANRAARRELDAAQSLEVVDRTLRCRSGCQAELATALHDAALRQRSRLLWLGKHDERLMVVAMPIRIDDCTTPTALIVMGRRSLCSPLGLEMLAIQHGLTLAERRVLRGLIDSRTAREIAAAHGVGLPTVRTQIQSVREKLGVRSIDALLLRAAQVPPISAWLESRGDA